MNLDWKKLGVMALFIGAVILFGFFIYYFFFRVFVSPPEPLVNVNEPIDQLPITVNINGRIFAVNTNGGFPLANINEVVTPLITEIAKPSPFAQGGITQITQLTDRPSLFAIAGLDGQILYYSPIDSKFYAVRLDGTIAEYNSKIFHNVSNVTWSKNRNKAILEYPDGSNIVYDFKTNEQITLPPHWSEFNFSYTDEQIGFKSDALDPENRFLAISNIDGSQPIILEKMGKNAHKFSLNWSPNNQMVAIFVTPKDQDRSEVYFIGKNQENFKLMIVDGLDFRGKWSPDGNKIVYSVYNSQNDFKPTLWISSAAPGSIGDNRKSLNLNTWVDKCTFSSNDKVYCAVPTELPFGAGMDDTSADNIPDRLYEIDLSTGSKTLIATPEGDHTIENIIINEQLNKLMFTDKNSNRIYSINL